MLELFEYVEPSDKNLECYSYRIHALLMRVAIEVEANCRAILIENNFPKQNSNDLKMPDYHKINASHKLSSYEVKLPVWHGLQGVRKPFANWATTHTLPWYRAYNSAKHDRHENFLNATFEHAVDAMCGLAAIISSQFYNCDFSPNIYWHEPLSNDGFQLSIGDYLQIRFPKSTDWLPAELYDFDWKHIEAEADPFQEISF